MKIKTDSVKAKHARTMLIQAKMNPKLCNDLRKRLKADRVKIVEFVEAAAEAYLAEK